MSRWDDPYNEDSASISDEEASLLRKFQDYKALERLELDRQKESKNQDKTQNVWTSRFLISTIVQMAAVSALSFSLLFITMSQPQMNLEQFLSLQWEGASVWFLFGYILYGTLIISTIVTAIFYNHIEVNLKKSFSRYKNFFSWVQLICFNLGGGIAATSMIIVGFSNMNEYVFLNSFNNLFGTKVEFYNQMATLIGGFVVVLILGALAGGISLITAFLEKKSTPYFAEY